MKKISEIYSNASTKRPVFSFEFFPPKNPEGESRLFQTIRELRPMKPDFVSVTYGAGGSTREKTRQWAKSIQEDYGILTMAHYTCVGSSRTEIETALTELHGIGIRNIMALRGDPPQDGVFTPPVDGFTHASELISFVRSRGLDFCLGGACYPEVHPEAVSAEKDLQHLKEKVDAGADFLVSQLFFSSTAFLNFVEKCRAAGIGLPIVPGIMPITQLSQVERFTKMTGCTIPPELLENVQSAGDNKEKLMEISAKFTIKQCRELLDKGAPGIHFYTLNQSHVTMEILKSIRADF